MVMGGLAAEVGQSLGCDPAACDWSGNPVADLGRAVVKVIEIEPTDDRPVAVHEHEEETDAGILLVKERAESFRRRSRSTHHRGL